MATGSRVQRPARPRRGDPGRRGDTRAHTHTPGGGPSVQGPGSTPPPPTAARACATPRAPPLLKCMRGSRLPAVESPHGESGESGESGRPLSAPSRAMRRCTHVVCHLPRWKARWWHAPRVSRLVSPWRLRLFQALEVCPSDGPDLEVCPSDGLALHLGLVVAYSVHYPARGPRWPGAHGGRCSWLVLLVLVISVPREFYDSILYTIRISITYKTFLTKSKE